MPLSSPKFPLIYAKDINRLITSLVPTGRVIFQDDMEGLLKWVFSGTAGGSVSKNTALPVFDGDASIDIATAATTDALAAALRRVDLPFSKRVGLEGWINLCNPNLKFFEFDISWYDGVKDHMAELRYDVVNKKWQYSNSALVYIDIPEGDMDIVHGTTEHFDYVKQVADFGKDEYVALYVNGQKFDLTGIPLPVIDTPTTLEFLLPAFECRTKADVVAHLYVDNVICTAHEP